jgi:FkbM family methyltransferase
VTPATAVCRLAKPHYLYRPGQIVRRLHGSARVRLPWGLSIAFDPDEAVGSSISRTGVYDLPVTEAIYRLLDPDEVAVDAGAHIGYMTSVMLARGAEVHSFEPHPETHELLRANIANWNGHVEVHQLALSSRAGTGWLGAGAEFTSNSGVPALLERERSDLDCFEVRLGRLDEFVTGEVALLKVDVEGHEHAVLDGAPAGIRDVIFEEHYEPPTPTTELLAARGYRLYRVEPTLLGPRLRAQLRAPKRPGSEPHAYLAPLEPERTEQRFRARGWRCLRPRGRRNGRGAGARPRDAVS